MTDPIAAALDAFVPAFESAEGNWQAILSAASVPAPVSPPLRASRPTRRHLLRRRNVLIAAVVVAIIAPLTALAANRWWFLRTGLPRPMQKPVVVTRGSWSGHRWSLVAYPSHPSAKGYGLCWGVTFSGHAPPANGGSYGSSGYGAGVATHRADDGFGCDSFVGVQNPHLVADLEQVTGSPLPTVVYEWRGTGADGYPSWISGVVVASATHVVLRLPPCVGGRFCTAPTEAQVPTFPAHVAGYHVRLFAALFRGQFSPFAPDFSITGTHNGRVVACSSSDTNITGYSPLSSCKP